MNLKEAKTNNKMDQFIKEHEAKFPPADKKRLSKYVKGIIPIIIESVN